MDDPEPVVVVKNLNDYNVELELRAWLTDTDGDGIGLKSIFTSEVLPQ